MNLKEFFLKQKESIHTRSKQVYELITPEIFDWKPEKGALSVGQMLRHVWVSETGVRQVALEGDFTYYETRIPQGLSAVLGVPTTLTEELRNIERVHAETLAAVAAFPLDQFEQERVNPGLRFHRTAAVILFGINEHEIHHRAQLMTYVRMMGTPAPEPFSRR